MCDRNDYFKQQNREDFDPFQKQQPNQSSEKQSKHQYSSSTRRRSDSISPNEVKTNKGEKKKNFEIKLNFSFENDGQQRYLVIDTESDDPNIKIKVNQKQRQQLLEPTNQSPNKLKLIESPTTSSSCYYSIESLSWSSDPEDEQKQPIETNSSENDMESSYDEESVYSPFIDSSMESIFSSSDMSVGQKQAIAKDSNENHIQLSVDKRLQSPDGHESANLEQSLTGSTDEVDFSKHRARSIKPVFGKPMFKCVQVKRRNALKEHFLKLSQPATCFGMSESPNLSLSSNDSSIESLYSSSNSSVEQKQKTAQNSLKKDIQSSAGEESVSKSPSVTLRSNDSSMESFSPLSNPSVKKSWFKKVRNRLMVKVRSFCSSIKICNK